jgi:fused signal recognition particle receptor
MGLFDKFKKKSDESIAAEASAPAEATMVDEPEDKSSGGIFAKLKRGLAKTKQLLKTDIRDLFKKEGSLVDDEFLEHLRAFLIRRDIGPHVTEEIVAEIGKTYRARVIHRREGLDAMKAKLKQVMAQEVEGVRFAAEGPTVVMVVGVNGSGKTTSIAKLAKLFITHGKKVVFGAGDTFRAAAVEQLTIWAGRLGAEIVKGDSGSDPASVAHRAVTKAVESGAEVCIVDTAGRLQTQQNLMNELTKIARVIGKKIPEAPHEVLLVLDATAGQNGISQARGFAQAVKCTGIVLAKIDGTAKGGVIVPIRQQFGLPVKYVGVGEKAEDLALFDPEAFVDALFADMEEGE